MVSKNVTPRYKCPNAIKERWYQSTIGFPPCAMEWTLFSTNVQIPPYWLLPLEKQVVHRLPYSLTPRRPRLLAFGHTNDFMNSMNHLRWVSSTGHYKAHTMNTKNLISWLWSSYKHLSHYQSGDSFSYYQMSIYIYKSLHIYWRLNWQMFEYVVQSFIIHVILAFVIIHT